MIGFSFDPFINRRMFVEHALDQALAFHAGEAILHLEFIRHEQRPAPRQGNADLRAGEPAAPAEHNLPHRPGDAAVFEDERGNRLESLIRVVRHPVICPSSKV